MMAARWRIHLLSALALLIVFSFFLHPPYAALMAPHSRRDKAMSGYKAIKKMNKRFSGGGILYLTQRSRPRPICLIIFLRNKENRSL